MKTDSRKYSDFSETRLTFPIALMILVLLAVYFVLFFRFSSKARYLIFFGLAFVTYFFLKPKPESWLPILPLAFAAGGMTLPMQEFTPALATLLMFAFAFFFLIERLVWNKPLFHGSPYLYILLTALAVQVLSVFISIHLHHQYTWNAIRDGSSIFLFFPLVVMLPVLCRDRDSIRRMQRAVTVSILVVSAIGVAEYLSIASFSRVDMGIGYVYKGRVVSLFGNANIFAGYLELGIPVSLALFLTTDAVKWKVTALLALFMGYMSVLYTFSRGGLIATFIGSALTLLYIYRKKIWLPILAGIGAMAFLIASAGTFERQMSFILNPEGQIYQPTILHRFVSYKGFINQFLESPITGVGYGAEEYYWGRSRIYSFWEVRFGRSTESISYFGGLNSLFLNNAVKGGVISVSSVLLILIAIFLALRKGLKTEYSNLAVALSAGIFSFMTHQIMGNQLRFPTVNSLFWFDVGLLLTILAYEERRQMKVQGGSDFHTEPTPVPEER